MKSLNLTPRQWLIVAHDLLATAAAIVARFFIRFEDRGLRSLADFVIWLPLFIVYAGIIYFLFGLHRSKWRFTSLPDLFNIVRAVDRAGGVAAGARLRPGCRRTSTARSSSARSPSCSIGSCRWCSWAARASPTAISATPARCSTPRRPKPAPTLVLGPRRRCRSAAARDRKRRGQEDLAGRHSVAVAGRPRPGDPRHSGARRSRRSRAASSPISRDRGTHGRARWSSRRRRSSRRRKPEAILMRARRLGLGDQPAAVARRGRRSAAACAGRRSRTCCCGRA